MSHEPYRLTEEATERARARGLLKVAWYRIEVPKPVMKQLMRRSDARAVVDTLLWYALILVAGVAAICSTDTNWAIPTFFLYATLYAGPADSRWHEAGHGTAFRSRWLNEALYQTASFQVMRRPTVWRWSHARHHSDTLVRGRDPEIQVKLPLKPLDVIIDFIGFKLAPIEFGKALANAVGYIHAEERSFIPQSEWPKVVREARLWMVVYGAVIAAAIYLGSWLPLLLVGLPSIYGGWLYNFFGLTQHAGLPEDVLDHRLNSRTVLMNPVFRFLYWNMNYHVEHHMFPMVPYHALPDLHEVIKSECPPPYRSTWSAYREMFSALVQQWRDPSFAVQRPLPGTSRRSTGSHPTSTSARPG